MHGNARTGYTWEVSFERTLRSPFVQPNFYWYESISSLGSRREIQDEDIALQLLQEYWIAIVPAVGILLYLLTRIGGGSRDYPYVKKPSIMSRNEQAFYRALLRAAGQEYDVFGMVRIADLLEVESGTAKRQSWQNRINCKHIDFVLCDQDSQEPILAIEVDDRSHQRRDRQERDYFVDRAFEAADLPLLRIQATRNYSAKELRKAISETLQTKRSRKLASERRVQVG